MDPADNLNLVQPVNPWMGNGWSMYTEYFQWSPEHNSNSKSYDVAAGSTLHGAVVYQPESDSYLLTQTAVETGDVSSQVVPERQEVYGALRCGACAHKHTPLSTTLFSLTHTHTQFLTFCSFLLMYTHSRLREDLPVPRLSTGRNCHLPKHYRRVRWHAVHAHDRVEGQGEREREAGSRPHAPAHTQSVVRTALHRNATHTALTHTAVRALCACACAAIAAAARWRTTTATWPRISRRTTPSSPSHGTPQWRRGNDSSQSIATPLSDTPLLLLLQLQCPTL